MVNRVAPVDECQPSHRPRSQHLHVEIADDVVFTVEYSIRAAQIAVYSLLSIEREIPPITAHDKSYRVRLDAVIKAFE